MYLTQGGSVQRPLTSGLRGWLVGQVLCLFGPWLRARVSTQEGEDQGGGGRTTWPAGQVARPTGHHLASYQLNQVGNPSLDPYKYHSTGGNQNTHHILEIPIAKLLFLV
jgi:hypothetical protein